MREFSIQPVVSILETPAGFELNSRSVAERVGDFLRIRLQNYRPRIHIIPARKKGTEFSPDNIEILKPLFDSDVIYLGAGSPTYTVRQLKDSVALEILRARHARGAALVLASAAIVATGLMALPVYEIYKVGQDPFWADGLDLLGTYGLQLVFIPHWNNQDGGAELDTSHCFMGQARFDPLYASLPQGIRVVGLDELTALWIDFSSKTCSVMGKGEVHILDQGGQENFVSGDRFPISRLGEYHPVEDGLPGVSSEIWEKILAVENRPSDSARPEPPDEIITLTAERQVVRERKDWQRADEIRVQIEKAGWRVTDTPAGPEIEPVSSDY